MTLLKKLKPINASKIDMENLTHELAEVAKNYDCELSELREVVDNNSNLLSLSIKLKELTE